MSEQKSYTDVSEYIKDSSEIRYDLNENLHSKAKKYKNIFAGMFNTKPSVFTKIKDLKYYTGGYPKEDSPAKIDALVDSLTSLITMLDYLQIDDLAKKFKEKGISLIVEDSVGTIESEITPDSNADFESYLVANELRKSELKREDRIRIFNELLEQNMKLQAVICQRADIIKLEHAPAAQSLVGINSSDYKTCVNFAYKKLKNAKLEKPLEALEASVDSKVLTNELIQDMVK